MVPTKAAYRIPYQYLLSDSVRGRLIGRAEGAPPVHRFTARVVCPAGLSRLLRVSLVLRGNSAPCVFFFMSNRRKMRLGVSFVDGVEILSHCLLLSVCSHVLLGCLGLQVLIFLSFALRLHRLASISYRDLHDIKKC